MPQQDNTTTVVGQTRYRFQVPHENPTTPQQIADNFRAIDRVVNGLPVPMAATPGATTALAIGEGLFDPGLGVVDWLGTTTFGDTIPFPDPFYSTANPPLSVAAGALTVTRACILRATVLCLIGVTPALVTPAAGHQILATTYTSTLSRANKKRIHRPQNITDGDVSLDHTMIAEVEVGQTIETEIIEQLNGQAGGPYYGGSIQWFFEWWELSANIISEAPPT